MKKTYCKNCKYFDKYTFCTKLNVQLMREMWLYLDKPKIKEKCYFYKRKWWRIWV